MADGVGTTLGVLGLVQGCIKGMWGVAMKLLQRSPDAVIEIAIPKEQPLQGQPRLEWIHLQVENIGYKCAKDTHWVRGARVSMNIGANEYHMKLASVSGPKDEMDLERGQPALIPLVAKSGVPCVLYGHPLKSNQCYVTDSSFLKGELAEAKPDIGIHYIKMTIRRGDSEHKTERWFRLTVPLDGKMQIEMMGRIH
jgi:hypothetical protein